MRRKVWQSNNLKRPLVRGGERKKSPTPPKFNKSKTSFEQVLNKLKTNKKH